MQGLPCGPIGKAVGTADPTIRHMYSFAIHSPQIYTPRGPRAGYLVVSDGKIVDIAADAPTGVQSTQTPLAILPGLVDTHVHCNDPGRTGWETFPTATRAAAAGGITTLVDMPLNSSPVTTTPEALQLKIAAARGRIHIDVGFHAGLVPGNESHLLELIKQGILGVKSFMCHSGIDEFPATDEKEFRRVMPILSSFNIPLLVHAELTDAPAPAQADPRSYVQYMRSRPREWENDAVRLLIRLCREFKCPVHIVHLSSSDVLPDLAAAKDEGLPLTVETCPHYLYFSAEGIPDGATQFKCAPPIREAENREKLWQALKDGVIDFIASDHSPCEPAMKCEDSGDFTKAWGGVASLQVGLSVIWTAAAARGLSLRDVVNWMCTRPARMVGLDGRKGALAPGYDADFVLFDPDSEEILRGESLLHLHKQTPYAGEKFRGKVWETYLRGEWTYRQGEFSPLAGQILLRPRGGCGSEEGVE
jgi:allantoinase